MPSDSYTLREVAELLGVSKRTLQRRIKEGAFPRRFLAPGRHGLETRIPAEDVQRALEDLRQRQSPRVGRVEAAHVSIPATQEINESLIPYRPEGGSSALTQTDLESLRDAMLAIVREDREDFLATVQEALLARDQELAAIRRQLKGVQGAIDRLRKRLEAPQPAETSREGAARTAGGNGGEPGSRFEVDAVLQEIDELERLLASIGDG